MPRYRYRRSYCRCIGTAFDPSLVVVLVAGLQVSVYGDGFQVSVSVIGVFRDDPVIADSFRDVVVLVLVPGTDSAVKAGLADLIPVFVILVGRRVSQFIGF